MSSKEQPNDLNLERNLSRQLRYQTDRMVTDFISKHTGNFDKGKEINPEIVKDSNELRRNVLNMLERTCSSILSMFGKSPDEIDIEIHKKLESLDSSVRNDLLRLAKDQSLLDDLTEEQKNTIDFEALTAIQDMNLYAGFTQKHGWYEHEGAGIRHSITRDELAYELCEVIRKVYYVHMENKIPEKYKTEIIEQYNMKEQHVTTS